jgi:hypothetical protein
MRASLPVIPASIQIRRIPGPKLSVLAIVAAITIAGGYRLVAGAPSTKTLEFTGVAYPTAHADKKKILASSVVKVDGTSYTIGYNTILRSGQTAGDGTFGLLYDASGKSLTTGGALRISDDNDHSTLLDVYGKVFMVSHFESRPGAFYITELSQDQSNGKLTAVSTKPIDFSALGGGWNHCAGSRTPWKNHLGSEEYEPDARSSPTASS